MDPEEKRLKWKDLIPTSEPKVPIVIIADPTRMKGKQASQRYTFTFQTSFLTAKAYEYLLAYKAIIKPKPEDYLFSPNFKSGRFENSDSFWEIFVCICQATWGTIGDKKATKQYTPNSFRHFVTTAYTQANLEEGDILMLTGHARKDITKFYVTIDPKNPMQSPKVQDLLKKFIMTLPYLF